MFEINVPYENKRRRIINERLLDVFDNFIIVHYSQGNYFCGTSKYLIQCNFPIKTCKIFIKQQPAFTDNDTEKLKAVFEIGERFKVF